MEVSFCIVELLSVDEKNDDVFRGEQGESESRNDCSSVIALFGRQQTLGHVPHDIYEAYMSKCQKKREGSYRSNSIKYYSIFKCSTKKYAEMQ